MQEGNAVKCILRSEEVNCAKTYDGINIHQRIPVNGKELDKYCGVDGLNRSAKAGKEVLLTAEDRCERHPMKS